MAGKAPLRKRLMYRDLSGASLESHTAHWRDFQWNAGPVCVIHKGAAWGVPQVWAASAAEGKRVIRHAGAIAGIDPDTEGEWIITGSLDPRYGRTGRMGVLRLRDGYWSVTKREGPNGMPEVAMPNP
jgi:hypothetical protein